MRVHESLRQRVAAGTVDRLRSLIGVAFMLAMVSALFAPGVAYAGTVGWRSVSPYGDESVVAIRTDGSLWKSGALDFFSNQSDVFERLPVGDAWTDVAGCYRGVVGIADGSLYSVKYDWLWSDSYQAAPLGEPGGWTDVVAGGAHFLAVRSDGTLWAWGANSSGQLGLGDTVERTVPERVGADSDWAVVAGGGSHSLAIKRDGSLWAWGSNAAGQLGVAGPDRLLPTFVASGPWNRLAAGNVHSLATKDDGTLWAWGENASGQLGLGDWEKRAEPTRVWTNASVISVAAGNVHSVAACSDGTVLGWGLKGYTFVGASNSPVTLPLASASKVFAGGTAYYAIDDSGRMFSWGTDRGGILGLGPQPQENVLTPTLVAPITALSATPPSALSSWSQVDAVIGLAVHGDVEATTYRINNGASVRYTGPFTVAEEGENQVTYWSSDPTADEVAKSATVRIDRTAPIIECGIVPRTTSVRIVARDVFASGTSAGKPGAGFHSMTYAVDGAAPKTSYVDSVNLDDLPLGPHSITVTSRDALGNTNAGTFRITLSDTQAPVTSIFGVSESWVGSDVYATLAATDGPNGSGLSRTTYSVNGGPELEYRGESIHIADEGTSTIEYGSQDKAGNVESPRKMVSVMLDKSAPITTCNLAGSYLISAEIPLRADDGGLSGVALTQWRVDDGAWVDGDVASISTPGTWTLRFRSIDRAGNVEAERTKKVLISKYSTKVTTVTPRKLTLSRGRIAYLQAKLVPVAGQTGVYRSAVLQRSSNGKSWTTAYRRPARVGSYVRQAVRFTKTGVTYWRWYLPGSDKYESSAGSAIRVQVR